LSEFKLALAAFVLIVIIVASMAAFGLFHECLWPNLEITPCHAARPMGR
jgi:hypothetical protein